MRVLTGGKFNRIHPGHVWLLKKAKKMGYLIVVLAHDRHNNKSYAVPADERKRNIEKLDIADEVVIGSATGFVDVVREHKPDVIVLGYDQKIPDRTTKEYIEEKKIKVLRFEKHGEHATRKMS